jgi:hypothetical protein
MGTLASALRPLAAGISAAPRVYADANLPVGAVATMRLELRWDVLFVLEDPAWRRATDRQHYQRALELGRTLITLDQDFFDDRRFPPAASPGVIVCSAPDESGLRRILRHADRAILRSTPDLDLPLRGRKLQLTVDVALDIQD